jgi:glycerol-3-phosphate acyltransferase PlsX
MGSDTSPTILFEAVLQAVQAFDATYTFVVFLTQEVLQQLPSHRDILARSKLNRIEFHMVSDVIAMSDDPLYAVRHKKKSSLILGIRQLKKHFIDAFLTAGNTGALIASASLSLQMLPGISKPALLAMIPTEQGLMAVVDIGGNILCKSHHLVQFAHMGAAVQRCSQNKEKPTIGLLNIGVESKKGTQELRMAYQALQQDSEAANMVFKGNVEGREVLKGKVDVLVTDGFTGNVLLKSIEGTSTFVIDYISKACQTVAADQLQATVCSLQHQFKYEEYPGAIVCGVDGVIMKCHGHSSAKAFFNGIKGIISLVQNKLIGQIKQQLSVYTL